MAQYVEITVEQNATFTTTVTVTDATDSPVDLTNSSVKAQLKKSYYSLTAHDFTVTIPSPPNGEAILQLSAATTANITPGRYVYDVIMIDQYGDTTRLFEGTAVVTPGVTRDE